MPPLRTVLIVDDSALNRKLVSQALPKGYADTVVHAKNGAEALEILRTVAPHLILLDLNMPIMDGYQLLEALQQAGTMPAPIIVLSADVQPKARERVLSMGAVTFLGKPPSTEALREAIAMYGRP